MSALFLMAALLLGCAGLAAGCKWRITKLAWSSLAIAAAAAALLMYRHEALLIALAVLPVCLFKPLMWAFWPRHELPRHRVRHQRIRLFLRLHPGRGHATLFELWRHWSSRASAQKDRYAR